MKNTKLVSFETFKDGNSMFGDLTVILDENKKEWFIAKQVATMLGYKDTVNALKSHTEDGVNFRGGDFSPLNLPFKINNYGMKLIPESDVYCLIFGSKLTSAKKFKRWVTELVLPSIRKTGSYTPNFNNPVETARAWADAEELRILEVEKNKQLVLENKEKDEKIIVDAPKVDFYENYMDTDGLLTASSVAITSRFKSAQQLNLFLDRVGGIYDKRSRGVSRTFVSGWVGKGFGKIKYTSEGYTQCLFTPIGAREIVNIMKGNKQYMEVKDKAIIYKA